MPSQIEWDKYYLRQARELATFSKAERLKVGGILVRDNRPLANGYNGMPAGWDNSCEYEHQRQLHTKPECSHSEENLIAFCAKNGISTNGTTLYLTHSPCMPCCRLVYNSGIKRIVYLTEYRDPTAIEFCRKAEITLEQMEI